MKKTKALIFTSYFEGDLSEISKEINFNDYYLICADGGIDFAIKLGLKPDYYVGDLDSINTKIPKDVITDIHKPEKDETDLDLAIKKSIELGYKYIKIFGGIGGRLDHTLGNIQTMAKYHTKGFDISMFDSNQEVYIVTQTIKIKKNGGSMFSVISLTNFSEGVSIENAKYPIENFTLSNTNPLGVSNEFIAESATIIVKNGILAIIVQKK